MDFPEEVRSLLTRQQWMHLEEVHQNMVLGLIRQAAENPETLLLTDGPCWAPGADLELVDLFAHVRSELMSRHGLDASSRFFIGDRWNGSSTNFGLLTAVQPNGQTQGDATTLTWSYVRDGTTMEIGCGGNNSTTTSDLIAFLRDAFEVPAATTFAADFTDAPWHPVFVEAFNEWSAISGLTFQYEPNDDGTTMNAFIGGGAPRGILGTRGDIRIAGRAVDGNSNVLGCAYFPEVGDMIFDTTDDFFDNNAFSNGTVNNNWLNFLVHELGHGLGYNHVCPRDQTKIMEPFVSNAYRGNQFSEILAANRSYGDNQEDNDTPATATTLGNIAASSTSTVNQISIDDETESDYFTFTPGATGTAIITVTPTGMNYEFSPQNQSTGACPAAGTGTVVNTLNNGNLSVTLVNVGTGLTVGTANANAAGGTEVLTAAVVGGTAYRIQVQGTFPGSSVDAPNRLQMYNLSVQAPAALPVEYLYFRARASEGMHRLEWATAWELNSAHFAVERSTDGREFTEIGHVTAAGFSEEEVEYAFVDRTPALGLNYYRLRQVDLDGSFEWSEVHTLQNDRPAKGGFSVQPNPVSDRVTFRLNTTTTGPLTFDIFDGTGRLVQSVPTAGGASHLTFNAVDLVPGVYTTRVRGALDLPAVRWVKR